MRPSVCPSVSQSFLLCTQDWLTTTHNCCHLTLNDMFWQDFSKKPKIWQTIAFVAHKRPIWGQKGPKRDQQVRVAVVPWHDGLVSTFQLFRGWSLVDVSIYHCKNPKIWPKKAFLVQKVVFCGAKELKSHFLSNFIFLQFLVIFKQKITWKLKNMAKKFSFLAPIKFHNHHFSQTSLFTLFREI